MAVELKFLIASSLARLIRRERATGTRIVEGHFPARDSRKQFVRIEGERCHLLLRTTSDTGQAIEEVTDLPLAQAEALVEVAAGTVAFDRIELRLGHGAEAALDRFVHPSGLDLLTLTLSSDPRLFAPPLWVGREVTADPAFEVSQLALQGIPSIEETEVSNVALETLLDFLDGRSLPGLRWPPSEFLAAALEAPTAPAGDHLMDASSGRRNQDQQAPQDAPPTEHAENEEVETVQGRLGRRSSAAA
jgi:CYTH domain-containing protein